MTVTCNENAAKKYAGVQDFFHTKRDLQKLCLMIRTEEDYDTGLSLTTIIYLSTELISREKAACCLYCDHTM